MKLKKQGSSLLIAMFLSGLVLTIGLTASRLLLKETGFSADTILSEKAYFAAESGVEIALFELKNEPTQHINLTHPPAALSSLLQYDLGIINKIKPTPLAPIKNKFEFTLSQFQNQQFRLRYDSDNGAGKTIKKVNNFDLAVSAASGAPNYQWRITCQDASNNTQTLQKGEALTNIPNFLNHEGCLTTDNPPVTYASSDPCMGEPHMQFNNWSTVDKRSCFISFQNLGSNDLTFLFSNGQMAPHQAKIVSVGKIRNREKHIVFDYAQKNIGTLFNFTFFHTESGL